MKNLTKHHLYKIWDQVPVTYYQEGVKKNILRKIWHNHKLQSVKKILANRKFTNCLDVGCASGYMLSQVAASFPKASYTGVDVYDKAIVYGKKTYPFIKFYLSSVEKMPLKNDSYDLVICYETIEHVESPIDCLREAKRVLKKGGTFILAMDSGSPLFRLVWSVWEKTFGHVWQGAHLHPFHHKELEDVIKKSGLKIQDKFFTFFGMEVTFVLSK